MCNLERFGSMHVKAALEWHQSHITPWHYVFASRLMVRVANPKSDDE
jgi:hypothetical protein